MRIQASISARATFLYNGMASVAGDTAWRDTLRLYRAYGLVTASTY